MRISQLFPFLTKSTQSEDSYSYLRQVLSGSLYRMSDLRMNASSISDIHTQIQVMRALSRDSQIDTAFSFYSTDATQPNSAGDTIWAVPCDDKNTKVADIVNQLLDRWQVNVYAQDHIRELATFGNLYIPTTDLYKQPVDRAHIRTDSVALDFNTIRDLDFDILPSHSIEPDSIVHLYLQGKDIGYILDPSEDQLTYVKYPPSSIIHFSLGGLLGKYTIAMKTSDGEDEEYEIKFATPLLSRATQPTQTLSLLEDAVLLSSLLRVIRFVNVDCRSTEKISIESMLQQIKDAIEQQLAINTQTGDAQSYVNPQSPNNLIYIPKVDGQEAISITDLNMADTGEDSKLLDYYQNKKLSVLGIPKEALNFSSNEGLGGAGSVLSQRSGLYANILNKLKQSYISGWTDAIDTYFKSRGMSNLIGTYRLCMVDVITGQSDIMFEKRDSAINQATAMIELLKSVGIKDESIYKQAVTEILSDSFPLTAASAMSWKLDDKVIANNGGEF